LQLDQLLGDIGAALELGIGSLELGDPALAGVHGLAPGRLGSQAGLAMLSQFPSPGRQLTGIQPVATQPGAFLAMSQAIGLLQQALLLRCTEPATSALLEAWICFDFGRRGHHAIS